MYICTSRDYHSLKDSIVRAPSLQFCAHSQYSKLSQLQVGGGCPRCIIAPWCCTASKRCTQLLCVWDCAQRSRCAGVVQVGATRGRCVFGVVQQEAAVVGIQCRMLVRTASSTIAQWQHKWCSCCNMQRYTEAMSASAAATVCQAQCVSVQSLVCVVAQM
jgi:hypothetical protein